VNSVSDDIGVSAPSVWNSLSPNAVITICDSTTIRLRSDYDTSRTPASIRHDSTRAKMNMSIFRHSGITDESNACHNFDHFRRSRMGRGIVVSLSYHSRITIVI